MIQLRKSIVLIVLVLSQNLFGQKVSNIDFDEIKLAVQDSSSILFYPLLIERFHWQDAMLTSEEYKYIYYGNIYSDNYNPYGESDNEKKFIEIFNQKKYEEAIPYGEDVIKENPVNLKVLLRMLHCHHQLGNKETAQDYANMYFSLLSVIYASGDGKSIETAYVVIKVSDEYVILNDLDLTRTKQALVGYTDILTIDTKGQKPKKGEKKIKSLYFNVSKPFEYLQKLFKDEKE